MIGASRVPRPLLVVAGRTAAVPAPGKPSRALDLQPRAVSLDGRSLRWRKREALGLEEERGRMRRGFGEACELGKLGLGDASPTVERG